MKTKIVTLLLLCLSFINLKAQRNIPAPNANLIYTNIFAERIKVGGGTSQINASALLELNSNNKGLLLPRMTDAQMLSIVNPINGLIVYNTDYNCLYVKAGSGWINTCTSINQVEVNWNNITDKPYLITNISAELAAKANLASPTFTGTVSGITKAMVGLSNVDNTSDANKPISTDTQTALDEKLAISTASSTYAPIASPSFTTKITTPQVWGGSAMRFEFQEDGATNYKTLTTHSFQKPDGDVAMIVNSTGNVGIGTSSPLYKFHVVGNTGVTGDLAISGDINFNGNVTGLQGLLNSKQDALTNPITGNGTSGYLAKYTSSTTHGNSIIYESSGNVGIGTASPLIKLHVSNVTESELRNTESSSGNHISLYQQTADSYIIAGKSSGTPTQNLNIYTGGAERMRILANGNVGIGTISPLATLDVNGYMKLKPLTTTEINAIASPIEGMIAWNTTLKLLCTYNGANWKRPDGTTNM